MNVNREVKKGNWFGGLPVYFKVSGKGKVICGQYSSSVAAPGTHMFVFT